MKKLKLFVLAQCFVNMPSFAVSPAEPSCEVQFANEGPVPAKAVRSVARRLILVAESKEWTTSSVNAAALEIEPNSSPMAVHALLRRISVVKLESSGNSIQVPKTNEYRRSYSIEPGKASEIYGLDGELVARLICNTAK